MKTGCYGLKRNFPSQTVTSCFCAPASPALLNAAPRLAIPLGREISTLRRIAARRVIRQAALLAGLMSVQPIPILDIPMQALLQAGVIMRVGATYGHAPAGGISREILSAVVSALGTHYLAQTLLKFIPILGWGINAILGATATYLIGTAAIHYYEAGATIPLKQWLEERKKEEGGI